MFAVASGAAAGGMVFDWTESWFRTYYLFGAIVNVPVLALGTLYLLAPRRVADIATIVVAWASLLATVAVWDARFLEGAGEALLTDGIPAGSEVMPSAVRMLARYYSFAGFFIVVGGALYSSWRLGRGRQRDMRRIVAANALIATGTVVVAVGSGFAFYGRGWPFSVGLLIGVSLMFWGFVKTRGAPRPRPQGG